MIPLTRCGRHIPCFGRSQGGPKLTSCSIGHPLAMKHFQSGRCFVSCVVTGQIRDDPVSPSSETQDQELVFRTTGELKTDVLFGTKRFGAEDQVEGVPARRRPKCEGVVVDVERCRRKCPQISVCGECCTFHVPCDAVISKSFRSCDTPLLQKARCSK